MVTLEDDNYLSSESDNEIDTPAVVKLDDILKPTTVTLEKINEISDNILRNIKPVDNRTKQELIDDQFIPLDDRTYQQLQDEVYLSLESDNEIIEIDKTNAWDSKKTSVAKPDEIFKLSADYNRKLKAANKIKNKIFKKKIGQQHKSNKISKDWLKTARYLDTKDQDKINYIFVPPKKEDKNNIPGDAGHFVRTEIDSTDFKKETLASKVRRNKTKKTYLDFKKWGPEVEDKTAETINILQDIAALQPGKNAQMTAKKN